MFSLDHLRDLFGPNPGEVEKVSEAPELVARVAKEEGKGSTNTVPGEESINKHDVGILLAKEKGKVYDCQNKGPGASPRLSSPEYGEFLFEPWNLKPILDWNLQVMIVHDLEQAAYASPTPGVVSTSDPTYISPVRASFYLFQCYMYEFGIAPFDVDMACYWLRQTAMSQTDCRENHLAQAWCWRIHRAFNVQWDISDEALRDWMKMSIIRGHRKCVGEMHIIMQWIGDPQEREKWKEDLEEAQWLLNTLCAGIGMPWFGQKKMNKN
ncbi:hypothetical protein VKT23_012998 [Stygiomarasmius scandens]|uniref:Uncharacterized protein n=1 Tax=Marasmiellus scandens TaxID=2682957 RepID=A0ABR1J463_9AGAR